MRQRLFRAVPVLITLGVVLFVSALRILPPHFPRLFRYADLLGQLEAKTYDWRIRQAIKHTTNVPPNIGVVFLDDLSLDLFNRPENGGYMFPLPRFVYGMLLAELKAQGAKAVAFDMFFLDRNYERDQYNLTFPGNTNGLRSDEYFAYQLREAGNAILAAPPWRRLPETALIEPSSTGSETNTPPAAKTKRGSAQLSPVLLKLPQDMFATNALQVGITSIGAKEIDSDGVHRRCRAFYDDPVLKRRFWHVGILLAAVELGLDLEHPILTKGEVVLKGKGNVERRIPLDSDGMFYIPWTLPYDHLPSAQQENVFDIFQAYQLRGQGAVASGQFRDKVVIVGSAATGSNVGDRGSTPLENNTILCSLLWNVAAGVIQDNLIRRTPLEVEIALVTLLALLSGFLSWQLRGWWAPAGLAAAGAAYFAAALFAYAEYRYWVPIILPLAGAVLMTYICLVFYRVFVEMVERRRVNYVRAAFGERFPKEVVEMLLKEEKHPKVVQYLGLPPTVVRMLVRQESASRRGDMCRHVSIFFADIRDFTEFIDISQAQAEKEVQERGMSPEEAEKYMDNSARDVLGTVNLYLSTIAEIVTAQHGTLDKYVGDAVMAFWGAPLPDDRHAVAAVSAAIAAQRAIKALNHARARENRHRAAAREQDPKAPVQPPLPILSVGIAINSGEAIVGFMGSAALVSNYTVFGKEVNVASRLEGLAAADRIVISESTFKELERLEPRLAETCIPMEPATLRGIRKPVRIYELPIPVTHWTTSVQAELASG